jgi:hypothetical protein
VTVLHAFYFFICFMQLKIPSSNQLFNCLFAFVIEQKIIVFFILLVAFLQDDDEADTVGCCTLKVENVKPVTPNMLEVSWN